MTQLAGLILAAGVSSRMGAFKPMLPVDGQTMIRRVADMMRRAGADPILVVTGYRGEALERHLEGLNIRFIRNERYYSTQMLDSLVLGLERLGGETRRGLVSPADIPLVEDGRVFIFGGGHVAQALVPALAAVDFRCVVLEDREDFCRPELFPGVEETRLIQNDDPAAYQEMAHAVNPYGDGKAYYSRGLRGRYDPGPQGRPDGSGPCAEDAGQIYRRNRQPKKDGGGICQAEGDGLCRRRPGSDYYPHRSGHQGGDPGGDCRVHRRPAHSGAGGRLTHFPRKNEVL